MRIGVAGLGRMGAALAVRLIEQGHAVTVWNRTPEKTASLAAEGAALAANPAVLAAGSEVVITMLTDAEAIGAVYDGSNGLLAGSPAGRLFIEMSTVRPAVQVALASRVAAAGADFVECPVGGTVGPARAGKLLGLAGGEAAAVARARPVLEQLCRRVEHVGPVGAGASMKLAINLPLAVFWQAMGEAHALCGHLGVDKTWLVELFGDTSGGPNVLRARGAAVALALAGQDVGAPTFDCDGIRKDLRLMLAEAGSRGVELPVASSALEAFDEASEAGWGARDGTELPAYWSRRTAGG